MVNKRKKQGQIFLIKIFPLAFLLFFLSTLTTANTKIDNEIEMLKNTLVKAVKLSSKRGLNNSYKAVQLTEQLIEKSGSKTDKSAKYVEFNLFARQVVAGIYLHRLAQVKKAKKHYDFIIQSDFFQKNAPPVMKWIVYEGIGLSNFLIKKYDKALKYFLISLKTAKQIVKVKKGKGKSCISSSAYNIATVFAIFKKKKKVINYLKTSIENSISKQHKQMIIRQIKTDTVFKDIISSKEFIKLFK